MTDILLTHGYFIGEDEHEQKVMKPYPPLGLLYISAYLKRAGFGVDVFDTTFAARTDLHARLDRDPGVMGIYTNLITRASVLEIISYAKARGWTVVLGGPESANYSLEYLRHGADVITFGEGEETLAALLPVLANHGALSGVAGIAYLDNRGSLVTSPARPQITDLDTLPLPDREAIDIQRYVDVWRAHHGNGSVNLITARGCPYRCNWCSHAVYGFTHRRRGVVSCADELEQIVARYRPDQVWYADDVFTIHHRWLFDYAAELKRRGLRVPFETISRADRMQKDDVVRTLAEMGCWRIWIGAESGSQRILDAMERGVTVEQVLGAVRLAKQHGIQVGMFFMWGYDGETDDDIDATIDLVRRAAPDVALTTVAYPIKGTGFFARLGERVVATKDWAGATDRDYEVRGQRSREFYREADRRLREAVPGGRPSAATAAVGPATPRE